MTEEILFSRSTKFTGRNGYFNCGGVELQSLDHSSSVMLTALTGRGDVARCDIEIPVEAIPELLEKLRQFAPTPARGVFAS